MSPSILHHKIFLFSALSIPASTFLIKAYLHNHPISASKTRTITTAETLSPTAALSSSLHRTINPRKNIVFADSRSIRLSTKDIGDLSDEEILARFLKGFFGGWIFTPERYLTGFLKWAGMKFIPVGFSDIEAQGPTLSSISDFSLTSLPLQHSLLFGGNFMILDHHINEPGSNPAPQPTPTPSFLEVGFGDNRKQFAGLHRFELSRDTLEKEGSGVTICFSSLSCNPTVDKVPFPMWAFNFHKFYAHCLFRDGIREVLSRD